ncbi:MAG: nitric oxide synthase, partial [Pseudomonadota bacterium]
IFGMGDSGFADTFNFGPMQLTQMLLDRGAQQIGERYQHDSSGAVSPEDCALPWLHEVLAMYERAA